MCEALGYSMIIWSYQCHPLKIHFHITPRMTLSATVFENTQTMKCTVWSPSSCSPLLLWESTLRKETKWLGKKWPLKTKAIIFILGAQKLTKKKSEGLATEGLAKSGRHNPHSSERQSHTITLLILMSLLILVHFLSLQDSCLQFLY